ncbi:DoxX family protein [Arcobacter sp. LA11]|uniref:DoxX family protein n=1 Tax=Arcobacter sp. LA11 TaxID=1898176 RepID=UPI000934A86A|nr:DoxX family protein [Arcobacter sp. LA11]
MLAKIFNKRTIYFVITGFIAIMVGVVGGVVDIVQTQGVIEASETLGYPLYFFTLLGIFKILGGIALLLPRSFDRPRFIAYIGFSFDFIFASFSHLSVGDGFVKIIVPLVFLGLLAISYNLKNKF